MSEEKRDNTEIEKLTEQESTLLELHKERILSAESMLQLRRTEMQLLIDRIVKRGEENGKYSVLGIDPAKGISRVSTKSE